jgi:hypothetical protein
MIFKYLLALILIAAQEPSTAPKLGSIGGVVLDAGTGAPIEGVSVTTGGGSKQISAKTDAQGRYALKELPPGQYRVAVSGRGAPASKVVTLASGQEINSIDFRLQAIGTISGRVLDDNKEPVPGIGVWLVQRQYLLGELRSRLAGLAITNDRGEYRLTNITPGRAYLVLAEKRATLSPVSGVPADPKLRKPAVAPTYYPDSASIEGAQALVLLSGESREGVDIRMARSSSYCVEGVLDAGGNVTFFISGQYPSSGAGGNVAAWPANGKAGPDGKIRICDLSPGQYQLTAMQGFPQSVTLFGATSVTITDEDVRNVRLVAQSGLQVSGRVAWGGTPPDKAIESQIGVLFDPLNRPTVGDQAIVRSSVPGEFSVPLLQDEYAVVVLGLPRNLYLKDITYAGRSVLLEPLRPGSAVGNAELRVVLAPDGGSVSVNVRDKDNQPVPYTNVFVMPADARSEAVLASILVSGPADQNGRYESPALPPGKYFVLASGTALDTSPETIGRLWRSRLKAKEVDIGASAVVQVTLEQTEIN